MYVKGTDIVEEIERENNRKKAQLITEQEEQDHSELGLENISGDQIEVLHPQENVIISK